MKSKPTILFSIFRNYFKKICLFWRRQWHPTPMFLLGKSHGRGAWWAAVHGVAKSQTRLSAFTFTFHFHTLEKVMATHSSVLAWRIPGTGEPGGPPSMGSHRVGHDWSDLAAAACLFQSLVEVCHILSKTSSIVKHKRTLWGLPRTEPHPSTFHEFNLPFVCRKTIGNQEIPGVTGKFGLGLQNEGQRLTEFCQKNTLVLANTLFQQHKRWLCTWTSPDGQYQNQTDYILCSWRWRSCKQSAKIRPGVDGGSDHELLVAKFRLKLKEVGKTTRPFSSVQFSHSVVSNSLRPHGLQQARLPCPSPTPGSCSNSCALNWWCNHLILCRPLLLLPSIFPSIRVFSNESVPRIRWPKYWSFSFNSSPSNEYSWLISFRPFRYDPSQIPYDYTVEVRNRFKGLDLIDEVPEELWMKGG